MSELAELLVRVKAATGPDRELDRAIFDGLLGGIFDEAAVGQFFIRIRWDAEPVEFTASIDAALALVERKLPGAWYVLAKGRMTEAEPLFGCELLFGAEEQLGIEAGHTQALAIVAALLTALQAPNE